MNRFIISWLLFGALYCFAMEDSDSDFQLSDKRECSWSLSDEEEHDVVSQKRQKILNESLYYAVSPLDTRKVLKNKRCQGLMSVLMWQFVSRSYKESAQYEVIEKVLQKQDNTGLKKKYVLKQFFMRCPECDVIVQTQSSKQGLFRNMWKHWFLCNIHQPVFKEMKCLIARSEDQALAQFVHYGLPTARIVPFAYQSELGRNEQTWYLVDAMVSPQITYEGASQKAVVDQYFKAQMAALSINSEVVQAHAQTLMQQDALVKVLGVQDGFARKSLICPNQGCEYMVFEDVLHGNQNETHIQLFKRVALHCLQTHKVLTHTYAQALDLVAPSYQEAYEKNMQLCMAHESNNNFNSDQDDDEHG